MPNPQVTNKDLEERLKRLEICLDENIRAVKGHNGEIGLAGRMAGLEIQISHLLLTDLPHMKAEILHELKSFQDLYAKDQATSGEKNVQWPKLAEKFLFPIIVSAITAVVIAVIMSVIVLP